MSLALQSELAAKINETGYAFIASHLAYQTSREVIAQIGAIEKLAGLNEIQELTPKDKADSPPNIYSGNYGCDEFPFHTDLAHWFSPPHYFVLRCVEGTRDVTTRLIDSKCIVQCVGEDNLCRALVQPRRLIEMNRSLLRILERCSTGGWRFRWDNLFIVPATPQSSRSYTAIKESIATVTPLNFVLEQPGDTLIVDNWRMLHARSAVPKTQRNRRIHRAYLSALT